VRSASTNAPEASSSDRGRTLSSRRPVADYFRCADDFSDFDLIQPLSPDAGYFAFGADAICYGRSSSARIGENATGPLHDVLPEAVAEGGVLRLPLDPDEIVENLRGERYQSEERRRRTRPAEHPLLRDLYYRLRSVMPSGLRRRLQRAALGDWRNIPFPGWPVDSTVERVLERLLALSMKAKGVQKVPFIWFWPEGATSCVIMTHDVESVAGRDFCSPLMDLDDSVKIKASFQLVPERRYAVPATLLEEMRARGFEINVHDLNHDGHLFTAYDEFLRRARRINEHGRAYGARGFRSGGLYRNHTWYDALEFSYDMSVPSTGRLDPQRGGCCSLMPFFIGRILELPLTTTQDYALFHMLNDYSIELWKRQLDAIIERHGLASLLIHPDYIIDRRPRATYQALLEHLTRMRHDRRLWIALPNEVDRWWRQRRQMRIVTESGTPRVEGEGKDRARLAVATLVGDTVTLSVEGS
jgi:hypothetical protein